MNKSFYEYFRFYLLSFLISYITQEIWDFSHSAPYLAAWDVVLHRTICDFSSFACLVPLSLSPSSPPLCTLPSLCVPWNSVIFSNLFLTHHFHVVFTQYFIIELLFPYIPEFASLLASIPRTTMARRCIIAQSPLHQCRINKTILCVQSPSIDKADI